MKKSLLFLALPLVLFVSSCQKCYQCKQYCARCTPQSNTGVVVKFCATKDVSKSNVDSAYYALKSSGYDCVYLENNKRVCDYKNKLNDAVDYYRFQDYYCYQEQ